MADIFYLKLFLSFIIGAVAIVSATIIAEKSGPKIGALIVGFPINLVLGLFFIAWSQDLSSAVEATSIVPVIAGLNAIFLGIFSYFSRFSLKNSLLFSFLIWGIVSFTLIATKFNNLYAGFIIYFVLSLISYLFFKKVLKIKSTKGKAIKYSPTIIIFRALLSGSIIATAVYLGKAGGPILGGMGAMFPAAFTSTLVISYLSQGWKFTSAIAKNLILSQISIVMYSVAVRLFYQPLGLLFGTLSSILASLVVSYLIHQFVLKKVS